MDSGAYFTTATLQPVA